ncbi:hypothetical protein STIUS_v1c03740 [Spiroplasma sp. TIUS-1]|uniref:hypothetical protein n=1 Tax=Spiroplasma sp. TIUS-1 TaxID=216963 RepID=UPI0013988A83|nr:hypothetical protein [Spiroplasma sp. TIUS-1]QHX35928.1 hypothetical protein STIUS_v1c03740 [Spiroplasma sp. TIUS-1]
MNEKLYKQLVNLNYAVFSNDDMLTKILNDVKFKDSVLQTINGLMFLEKKNSVNLKGIQFGNSVGRALVKLINEKVAFSISNLNVDKIEEEIIFFSNFISNTYGISKDIILDSGIDIKEGDFVSFVKNYKENEATASNNTTIQDEATIQINAGSAENIKVNNVGANQQGTQNIFGGQSNMGQLFQNPMNSERFYPFKTKPKEMRWIKFAFAASILIIGILFIVIYAILGAEQIKISSDDSYRGIFDNLEPKHIILGADDTMKQKYVDFLKGNWILSPYTLISKDPSLSTGVNTFSIMMNIFMILILFSSVYPMLKQPKLYKDQYHVNGGTLFLFGFVIFIFIMPVFFNQSGGITSMIYQLGFKESNTDVIVKDFLKWIIKSSYLDENKTQFETFVSAIGEQMDLLTLKVLSIITIVFAFIFLAMYVAIILINPKLDREKYRLFIIEVQKKAMAQMQGQSYDIDPSLFESDEEMAVWEKKKNRDNK